MWWVSAVCVRSRQGIGGGSNTVETTRTRTGADTDPLIINGATTASKSVQRMAPGTPINQNMFMQRTRTGADADGAALLDGLAHVARAGVDAPDGADELAEALCVCVRLGGERGGASVCVSVTMGII